MSKSSGIDMSVVPKCLVDEGYCQEIDMHYTSTTTSNIFSTGKWKEEIPQTLICPICREVYLCPMMFSCGHTVCNDCFEVNKISNPNETLTCLVCKLPSPQQPIPNFIVTQLIEEHFPYFIEKRKKEIEEAKKIKEKLSQYMTSWRGKQLYNGFRNKMLQSKLKYIHLSEVILLLQSLPLFPQPSEQEVKFFLGSMFDIFLSQPSQNPFIIIGEYIALRQSAEQISKCLEAIEEKTPEVIGWSMILLTRLGETVPGLPPFVFSNPPPAPPRQTWVQAPRLMNEVTPNLATVPARSGIILSFDSNFSIYERLARSFGIDLGKPLEHDHFLRWKRLCGYWIRDLDLAEPEESEEIFEKAEKAERNYLQKQKNRVQKIKDSEFGVLPHLPKKVEMELLKAKVEAIKKETSKRSRGDIFGEKETTTTEKQSKRPRWDEVPTLQEEKLMFSSED